MEKQKDFLNDVINELIDEKELKEKDPEEDTDDEEFEDEENSHEEEDNEHEDDESEDEDEDEDEDEYLDDEEDDEDDEEDEEETPKARKTKEQRAHYAFEKLRKENKEKEDRLRELDDLAISYGFSNRDAMIEKLRTDAIKKQAKEKNIDPEIYKTLKEQERELEKFKEERQKEKMEQSARTILTRVNDFKEKHNLDDSDVERLLSDLDADGFTVEQLSRISNHEKLFTGYMRDKVIESERQKKLDREARRKKLRESKLNESGRNTEYTIDDLINSTINKNRDIY